MKLGISMQLPHETPTEWAQKHRALGLESVVFPCDYHAPIARIDAYAAAAREAGLVIAEVGAWCNPLDARTEVRENSRLHCIRQLELAEYVGARCCVNIAGTPGEVWDGSYAENYTEAVYAETVSSVQEILDTVRPRRTRYALECMPHMIPDSPENYQQLISDINRSGFGVHLDAVNLLVSPRVYFQNRELVSRAFALLGSDICSCHIKDAILDHTLTVSIRETECGQGGFDIAHYIRQANTVSPDLPMIVEHMPNAESFLRAVSYIQNLPQNGESDASKGKESPV